MLFSEIYSAYYNTVASIITSSQKGQLNSDSLFEIVRQSAFPESYLTIGSSLENEKWPLIKKDYTTNIQNNPTMPLTLLQKQWLKSLLADSRFCLFVASEVQSRLENDLQDIEPLFNKKDFYLYDKYADGDSYDDPVYIRNFRTIIQAIHTKRVIKVEYISRYGQKKNLTCSPCKIEYSEKDDKFRVLSKVHNRSSFFNIARIVNCELTDNQNTIEESEDDLLHSECSSVTLEIYDERKAMERMMLAFAHFEKSAVQIAENIYHLTIKYDNIDETELVIRVLSFGPMVKVLEPKEFKKSVQERIFKQINLMKNKYHI